VAFSEIIEETPDIMKISLGNLRPKQTIKIFFSYIEQLEISLNKLYVYKIPAGITPRYCSYPNPV